MKKQQIKSLVVIGFFIIVTGAAMANLNKENQVTSPDPPQTTNSSMGDGVEFWCLYVNATFMVR